MGGGSSSAKKLPDTLDEEATKSYAGDKWDKGKFDSFKGTDGLITKEQLLKAHQESEQENEQKPRRRSIDLTSPTGEDLTKDMSFSSGIKRNDTMAKHKTASLTKMGDLLGSSSGSLLQSTMEEGDEEEEEEEEGEDAVPALAPAPVKRRGSGLGLVSETGEDLTKDLSFSSSIK